MKMTIDGKVIEGTAEEIAKLLEKLMEEAEKKEKAKTTKKEVKKKAEPRLLEQIEMFNHKPSPVVDRSGRRWSTTEDDLLKAGVELGKSTKRIADMLGRTVFGVQSRAKELKIKLTKKRK
jgi:CRP-like cAMP-binding protein